jgi:hypothetical protein
MHIFLKERSDKKDGDEQDWAKTWPALHIIIFWVFYLFAKVRNGQTSQISTLNRYVVDYVGRTSKKVQASSTQQLQALLRLKMMTDERRVNWYLLFVLLFVLFFWRNRETLKLLLLGSVCSICKLLNQNLPIGFKLLCSCTFIT